MKKITVLGSTGSIGVSTLDVVARLPEKYKIIALTANSSVEKLLAQCVTVKPDYAVMVNAQAAEKLQQGLRDAGLADDVQVLSGVEGLEKVASLPEVDQVMAAIVGAAGLLPTLAAARAGKRVLLANKEALVMSGQLFIDEIEKNNAELLPIDSEHNAIFQCMPTHKRTHLPSVGVKRILLTSSGGPFLKRTLSELGDVTPDQACAHPNWAMGRKISVDSATMMNKGLEVIEAHWLFNAPADDIQVVVHPQSVIHSMVEYDDGSVLAQMGNPDMRTPIAHAMAWPDRTVSGVGSLNLFDIARLDFEEPDFERFACLRLAFDALRRGGTSTTILNAANEIAVDAFLNETISFLTIPTVIESVMNQMTSVAADTLGTVLQADAESRAIAIDAVKSCGLK